MTHWQPSEKAEVILQRWCPNVSKDKLTLKDLRFVVKALQTLSVRWEEMGMTVGVKDLDKIKKEYRRGNVYKCLIAVVNSWLSGNYNPEGDGSNAPSWWKIVDVVADDIGGADPSRAKYIAENWQDLGKDKFSSLAMTANSFPLYKPNETNANRMKLISRIARELQGVSSKWFEVATLLGIPVNTLNSIKEDCDDTEGCFKGVIKEWLSGRYTEDYGYPTPSLRVLVDVVEHPAGGANPALAKELAKLTFQKSSSTNGSNNEVGVVNEPMRNQADLPSPMEVDDQRQCQGHASQNMERTQGRQPASTALQDVLHRHLAMKDLFEITQYLRDMNNEQLKKLGCALGLHYPSVEKMKTLPDDVVAAWLLRQEDVLKRSGEPTYERLAIALEKIGQNGLAKDVREQIHTKFT